MTRIGKTGRSDPGRCFQLLPYLLLLMFFFNPVVPAQGVSTYDTCQPSITCTRALYGSEAVISLRNLPSSAMVLCSLEFEGGGGEAVFLDDSMAVADLQGRLVFNTPPLDKPVFADRTFVFNALWQDDRVPGNRAQLSIRFRVENPELVFSSVLSGGEGMLSKYDELADRVIAEVASIDGRPLKITFSRDFRKGFVMLDRDRIAVFDNLSNRLTSLLQVGLGLPDLGLADIALTPDGTRLVALSVAKNRADSFYSQTASLWVYDARSLRLIDMCFIDRVSRDGTVFQDRTVFQERTGDLLAVTGNSTLVYIRQEGTFIGQYNLLTGCFTRFQVGGAHLFGSEVRDIKVAGNCLVVLLAHPDEGAFLYRINTQNYQESRIRVGSDPREIKLYSADPAGSVAAVLDTADSEGDVLFLVDLISCNVLRAIFLPDGALDYDTSEASGLCMILYPGDNPGEGLLRFVDMIGMGTLPETVPIPMADGARVYLSRSGRSGRGYVYSESGAVAVIDLGDFRINGHVKIKGVLSAPTEEVY